MTGPGVGDPADDWLHQVWRRVSDNASWPPRETDELGKLLFKGVLAYGLTSDESQIRPLTTFYEHCIGNLAVETRNTVYRELRDGVMRRQSSINTLLPFLFVETAPTLVSEAVLDYCMTATPDPEDPLRACKDVCRWLQTATVGNRGAMFGGLLCLGDERVNPLLDTVKWTLGRDEAAVAAQTFTGMPFIAQIEFWLSWAEEAIEQGLGTSSLFGSVLSGLVLVERRRTVPTYHSATRNFGYLAMASERQASVPPGELLEAFTPQQVAARYERRLYALEAAEPAPKLASDVLVAFGLQPKAPAELRGVLQ